LRTSLGPEPSAGETPARTVSAPSEQRRTFCRFCNVGCGAIVTLEGDQVVAVRGDRDHPISHGYLCPKGQAMGGHHHHPRRLDEPMIRRDGRLEPVSWPEMLAGLSSAIRAAIAAAGPAALGMYRGTSHSTESAAAGLAPAILGALGSPSWYTSSTVDCAANFLVAETVAGSPWVVPVPDLDCRLTVLVGTNPMASHGHTFNISRPKHWLRTWAREGELWVIDPRRTESADVATAYLAPRPGTDYLLFAHLVRELLRDGADRAYLSRHATGVEELTVAVEPFTLERAVHVTGVPAEQITALLERIRANGKVAMVIGTGVSFQAGANLSTWMAWMVSAVTGSLDRPGGMWCNPGYLHQAHRRDGTVLDGSAAPGPASRPELPGRFGELPCAAVVDEIESGNLRAMVIIGGNPLVAWPQPERVARALSSLEMLAVIDVIDNPVTALATHVLPAASQLERADVPTGAEVFALQSFSQYADAVVPPRAQRRPTWWILAQLARSLGLTLPAGYDPDTAGEADVLRAMYGDTARWAALHEAGTAVIAEERPYGWVHDRLPDQRLRLAPAMLVEQLRTASDPQPSQLTLIPRRLLRKNNSTLADGEGISRGAQPETVMHPDDAATRGVQDGTWILVTGEHGTLRTRVRLEERAARGTVSTPHGFVDVNAAELASAYDVDPLTGMPRFTGLSVDVAPA
jgi:anaerobic selenocysteine-containing dehydrogenase